MPYLLDTNILSELVKKTPSTYLISKLRSKQNSELFTSSICVMELRFGSRLREDFESFWDHLDREVISRINILPVGGNESVIAGDILGQLRIVGQTIGVEDVLIAASAINNNCIMVTGNIRHFSRIEGLVIENWLKATD